MVLKYLCDAISYPLSIIFNQSFVSGVFPEKMKMAEIIPLFKGKEEDLVENYRPILLLMALSKVLEKLMYKQIFSFLMAKNTFFDSQYGFRSKRSCEHAILEMVGHLLQAKKRTNTAFECFWIYPKHSILWTILC